MTKREYLLICVMEECNELAQAVSKMLRFGNYDTNPNTGLDAQEQAEHEFNDLFATLQMLQEDGTRINAIYQQKIEVKREKIKEYIKYSTNIGVLEDE